MRDSRELRHVAWCTVVVMGSVVCAGGAFGDGTMVAPKGWDGSIEEFTQDAIIIFHASETPRGATEDLILKIGVKGGADRFAWVVPFPSKPEVAKEDAKLFDEVYAYVAQRKHGMRRKGGLSKSYGAKDAAATPEAPVDVLSRKIVGKYDVAVVRENVAGALNKWLDTEGYQSLPDAEDVIGFYRKKRYVFACIKVSDAELQKGRVTDLHPLRFTFKPGGRDGIYFPMKMTGLQKERFDVNLYVFYRYWVNDHKSRYGYEHRGFSLYYRDWDTRACVANGGKAWSAPARDPFLKTYAGQLPTVTKLFQKRHPGATYYLTNIRARRLNPEEVRAWTDDLWLFPYYTDPRMVPFDARPGGPAATAYHR